ncbi:MAG: nucleotidyltransferase domain-containing protein [Coriobacteriia bacterium]|nr:nucleotidyltransferase domain-containing protein [Coriobacteriia bacterium]
MRDPINILKEALVDLAPRYGVDRAYLFGSQARGDALEDSDIDLVVELGRPLGFKRGRLCLEIESALGMPVDLVFGRNNLSKPVRESFENDAVIVYERH